MTPEAALAETVRTVAAHAEHYADDATRAPWLVISAVLAAQQAAAIALRAAGDSIPAQAGATELLLRAAAKDRLPPPFTLPFGAKARHQFERLVEVRNQFMHPRGLLWHVSDETLWPGLQVVTRTVRHLMLIQPVLDDLLSPVQQKSVCSALNTVNLIADFYAEPDL